MRAPEPTNLDAASPVAIGHLERACDRFEAAWRGGLRPAIEDYWGDSQAPGRTAWLRELLMLELAYRLRAGERPTPEEYRRRFPAYAATIATAFQTAAATRGSSSDKVAPGASSAGPLPEIPGYTILGELGRGGMGVVYKARQESLNRTVALKMILAGDFAGLEAVARLRAEAEVIARLLHPDIVRIHAIGTVDGLPYLELEYVEGGSLDRRLGGTPWPVARAARLVERLARAIAEAHKLGVLHRDIKPANILLTVDGQPKITDFGLAKALGAELGLTRTDSILGSPSYMAPEQAEGKTREVGPAADIYALGAVLYELLTGRPPFRGATVLQTLEQVKAAEPVPPSRLVPGLPRDIETIALKCLQKDPTRRYATADALAEDLRRFLAGEPISARPVGPVERAWMWARRRKAAAVLAGVSLLTPVALIVVLAAANVLISRQQRETQKALREEMKALVERTIAQRQTQVALQEKLKALDERTTALDRERRASYFQRIALAERENSAGQVGRAAQLLEDCPEELRGWEWNYLRRLGRSQPLVLRGHNDQVWDAVISRDSRLVASAAFDKTVRIWDAATGIELRSLKGHTERVYSVAFSNDGRHLVSASADKTVRIWDVPTARELRVLYGHTKNVRCAQFSPDDQLIVSGSWDCTLRIWNAESGECLRVLPCHSGWITRLDFSPDGRRVVCGGTFRIAEVWEVATGERLVEYRGHQEHIVGIAFSPDGQRVASTSASFLQGEDGEVRIWNSETGQDVLTLHGHHGIIERVAYSPDGHRLATASWDKTVKLWDASTGQEVLTLRGHQDRVFSVAFSPDGKRLISAGPDRTVRIWDAMPMHERLAREIRSLSPGVGRVLSVAFSPDGKRFVAVGLSGCVLRDAGTGAVVAPSSGRYIGGWGAAFSPDGRRFYLASYQGVTAWDAASGRELYAAQGRNTNANAQGLIGSLALACPHDGGLLATADFAKDVVIRDPADGHEVAVYGGHTDRVGCLAFSPVGRRLASGGEDRTARIWDTTTGRAIMTLTGHGERVTGLAFSPDGSLLATSSLDGTIRLWDVTTGRETRAIRGVSGSCVAYSPDGKWVASALHGGTVRLWDPATGEEGLTMAGHAGTVDCLAFNPTGDRLISGGQDQLVKIWELSPQH
jgi:WD40 repeat protein